MKPSEKAKKNNWLKETVKNDQFLKTLKGIEEALNKSNKLKGLEIETIMLKKQNIDHESIIVSELREILYL